MVFEIKSPWLWRPATAELWMPAVQKDTLTGGAGTVPVILRDLQAAAKRTSQFRARPSKQKGCNQAGWCGQGCISILWSTSVQGWPFTGSSTTVGGPYQLRDNQLRLPKHMDWRCQGLCILCPVFLTILESRQFLLLSTGGPCPSKQWSKNDHWPLWDPHEKWQPKSQ